MKKVVRAIVVIIAMVSLKPAFAQMGAAQKIVWDVTKDATINADQSTVWAVLSDLEAIQTYANGFITAVEVNGSTLPFERIVTFEDGSTRSERIQQLENQHKFMAYQFNAESLPSGVTDVSVAVFTKAEGDSTVVSWMVRIQGEEEAKKTLMAQFSTEFGWYATGLADLFEHAVPAVKMN